ncbi:MAG: hypothetical protein IT243_09900 [Bacteroidia bacterium]|nr:hypothetical protein [Bacteroidia bacterium]
MSLKVNKDIEKILAEGAQNFEEIPSEQVWLNIKKGKNSKFIFLFNYHKWRIASTIALLAIVSIVVYYFLNTKDQQSVVKENSIENKSFIPLQKNSIPENEDLIIDNKNTGIENAEENISNNSNNNNKSGKQSEKILKKNIAKSTERNDKEIISGNENYNSDFKIEIIEIHSKLNPTIKYIDNIVFEKYTPVSKKFKKNYIKNKEKEQQKYKNSKGTYSLEIGGGPSYLYRKLSGGNYLLRNESEKPLISFQTNFKVNYHINNSFSIQSGLIVETRNEKLNYNHAELRKKLTQTPKIVTVYHPILPPKNITVIDSTYTNETVKYDFENINKYTSFNIPLILGYNFGNSKQQYRISAGTLVNIFSSNNAKIIEKSGHETVLTSYKEPHKINPSIYSAVAYSKIINNHYSLVFELSYYKNLFNRFDSESITKQINSGINFTSAIKYNIIKK